MLNEVSQRLALKYLKKGKPEKFMNNDRKFANRMKGNERAMKKVNEGIKHIRADWKKKGDAMIDAALGKKTDGRTEKEKLIDKALGKKESYITRVTNILREQRLEAYLIESLSYALDNIDSNTLVYEMETKYPDTKASKREWLDSVHKIHNLRVQISHAQRTEDFAKLGQLQKELEDATMNYAHEYVIEGFGKRTDKAKAKETVERQRRLNKEEQLDELHGKGSLENIEAHHSDRESGHMHAAFNSKLSPQEKRRHLNKMEYHRAQSYRAFELTAQRDAAKDKRQAASDEKEAKGAAYTQKMKARVYKKRMSEEAVNEAAHSAGGGAFRAGIESGGDDHIITQLRKVVNLRGGSVTFKDKSKHPVHPIQAHRALERHDSMRTAAEKGSYSAHIGQSHDHFLSGLAGKAAEHQASSRKKISLAGSPRIGGTNPNWRAYRTRASGET